MKIEDIVTKLKSLIDKNASDISTNAAKIDAVGTVSEAYGTYTTAKWTNGTNTCTWTAPAAGTYLLLVYWVFSSGTPLIYAQIQLSGTAKLKTDHLLFYSENMNNLEFKARVMPAIVVATAAGQTICPYIHTDIAGTAYNFQINAVRIK